MQYLVYNSPFGLSGKKLAEALSLQSQRLRNLSTLRSIAVAWGAPTAPKSALNGQISVGKLNQLRTWKSADLSTLEFSTSPRLGWLARSGGSFGGRDFLETSHPASYWTKTVMNVEDEYRVHVCLKPNGKRGNPSGYQVIRLGYKVNHDESLNRMVEGVQIRSRQFGWRLKYFGQSNLRRQLSADLDLAARWAIATIGWDFGAIDVLKTTDGKYVLLEANSAPGLKDEATCAAYATAIKAVLDA